jgi:hypothetical protein
LHPNVRLEQRPLNSRPSFTKFALPTGHSLIILTFTKVPGNWGEAYIRGNHRSINLICSSSTSISASPACSSKLLANRHKTLAATDSIIPASFAKSSPRRTILRTSDRCLPHAHPPSSYWQLWPCCSCLLRPAPELCLAICRARVAICHTGQRIPEIVADNTHIVGSSTSLARRVFSSPSRPCSSRSANRSFSLSSSASSRSPSASNSDACFATRNFLVSSWTISLACLPLSWLESVSRCWEDTVDN